MLNYAIYTPPQLHKVTLIGVYPKRTKSSWSKGVNFRIAFLFESATLPVRNNPSCPVLVECHYHTVHSKHLQIQ